MKSVYMSVMSDDYIDNTYMFSKNPIRPSDLPNAIQIFTVLQSQFLGDISIVCMQYDAELEPSLIRTERDVYLIPHSEWENLRPNDIYIVNEKFLQLTNPDESIFPLSINKLASVDKLEELYENHGVIVSTSPMIQ